MYNIRYHLITIIAVFIALGLGIFLGGLIVTGSSGMNSTELVNTLKNDFTLLRAENDSLAKEKERLTAFSGKLSDAVIKDKLDGMIVAVLGTNNRPTELARQALEKSSAKAIPIVVDSSKMSETWPELLTTEMKTIKAEQGIESDLDALTFALAREWSIDFAGTRIFTDELVKIGVLSIPDYPNFKGVHASVNVAMSGDQEDTTAFAISDQLYRAGITSVGLSLGGGNTHLATLSWEHRIPSSDQLGNPIGAYTITALLLKAEPGYYGASENARALYPVMPVERFVVPVPAGSTEPTATTEAK